LREKFPPQAWGRCEFRVEDNTRKILDLLDKYDVKATFFVLGWIAKRKPELVREIHLRGHEIASHAYGHIINYELSRDEIYEDIKKSKVKGVKFSYRSRQYVGLTRNYCKLSRAIMNFKSKKYIKEVHIRKAL